MAVVHGGMVESEVNRPIEKRFSRKTDPEERDELWKTSVAAYNARIRQENRLAWCDYFSRLAGSLRARAEEYDQRAVLLEDRGEGIS